MINETFKEVNFFLEYTSKNNFFMWNRDGIFVIFFMAIVPIFCIQSGAIIVMSPRLTLPFV